MIDLIRYGFSDLILQDHLKALAEEEAAENGYS